MIESKRLFQVDAFSDRPFSGNPAGVYITDQNLSEDFMQNIALEMHLSETAYVVKINENHFGLRWFTPTTEVKLCGHATLSAAHILFEQKIVKENAKIKFQTLSGDLFAHKEDSLIVLDFPARKSEKIETLNKLDTALGQESLGHYKTSEDDILVELKDEYVVRNLLPNINLINQFDARGIIVTARSDSDDIDFVSRFFAPRCGVPEDPVTGSAHCSLFPYWGERLKKKSMTAFQASPRGGYVKGALIGDRVILKGHAVTVFEILLCKSVTRG